MTSRAIIAALAPLALATAALVPAAVAQDGGRSRPVAQPPPPPVPPEARAAGDFVLLQPLWLAGEHSPSGTIALTAELRFEADGRPVAWTRDPVAVKTLIDSALFAGCNARRLDLGHGVAMDAIADDPAQLAITDAHLATYRDLVAQALALFGARHFDHYDFLYAFTTQLGDVGLEHHRSSENSARATDWTDWDAMGWDRYLTVPVDYHGGPRWPWLEPAGTAPAGLDRLLAPRAMSAAG